MPTYIIRKDESSYSLLAVKGMSIMDGGVLKPVKRAFISDNGGLLRTVYMGNVKYVMTVGVNGSVLGYALAGWYPGIFSIGQLTPAQYLNFNINAVYVNNFNRTVNVAFNADNVNWYEIVINGVILRRSAATSNNNGTFVWSDMPNILLNKEGQNVDVSITYSQDPYAPVV